MRDKTCCFSGHRTIRADHYDIVAARTEIAIRELILKHNVRFFGCGGAVGYDYLCSSILIKLRETDFPHIKVILIAPAPPAEHQSRWTQEQRDQYAQIWDKFDKKVFISDVATREAYLARNRHMVDNSGTAIVYLTR